jgi:hypothetical protein
MQIDRTQARLTAPDQRNGLDGAGTVLFRALRNEGRAEERRLDHVRRIVEGHLDRVQVALAERHRDSRAAVDENTLTGLGHH